MNYELRYMPGVEIRAEGESKRAVGYAAVFNSLSVDLGGFKEIIKPGAFNRAFNPDADVRALKGHDRNLIVGRTKAGTLTLSQNSRGLFAEVTLPDTTVGRDLAIEIERGDIDGMSFAFRTISDNWRMKDGVVIRELLDVDLIEVSFTAFPAYQATSATIRDRFNYQDILCRIEHGLAPCDDDITRLTRIRDEVNDAIRALQSYDQQISTYKYRMRVAST